MIIINYYKAVEAMLYSFKRLQIIISNIDLEIDKIRNEYNGCSAISYEEKSAPTNKFSSSVENEVELKEKQVEHLEHIKQDKIFNHKQVENALTSLDSRSYEIVKLRYFEQMSNQEVAIKLDLTEQRVSELKTEIVKSLIDLIFVNKFK